MRLQVEQLEKEKKDHNERLRIAAKRIDHVERAYRKEERPLLAQDYADQQAADRVTFEALQKSRIENSLAAHTRGMGYIRVDCSTCRRWKPLFRSSVLCLERAYRDTA